MALHFLSLHGALRSYRVQFPPAHLIQAKEASALEPSIHADSQSAFSLRKKLLSLLLSRVGAEVSLEGACESRWKQVRICVP